MSLSLFGLGILSITASSNASTPSPVFPEQQIISSLSNPIVLTSSSLTFSGFAFGKSILLITGIIFKSASNARYKLANVWASIPWVASTTRIAPSQAARLRLTS